MRKAGAYLMLARSIIFGVACWILLVLNEFAAFFALLIGGGIAFTAHVKIAKLQKQLDRLVQRANEQPRRDPGGLEGKATSVGAKKSQPEPTPTHQNPALARSASSTNTPHVTSSEQSDIANQGSEESSNQHPGETVTPTCTEQSQATEDAAESARPIEQSKTPATPV